MFTIGTPGRVFTPFSMKINTTLTPKRLGKKTDRVIELAGQKIHSIARTWDPKSGTPVFTVRGTYTSRGWTEWTQGFQFGMAFLHFDATGDAGSLAYARKKTVELMASHVSHTGVHDHGFNNVSTYGNLRRLIREGRLPMDQAELDFAELALKVSGAVQAARHVTTAYRDPWSPIAGKAGVAPSGYVYSFNGPQSLFADTIRSMRSLVLAHQLGHVLMGEGDKPINLLHRAIEHAATTARFNVFFGNGRDRYDVRGRVAHESIFNRNDGQYRCPSSQQGYSPFTTWTRGASWIICGFAEQLEFLDTVSGRDLDRCGGRRAVTDLFVETATRPGTASRTGTTARPNCTASATTARSPPIPTTPSSPWTAPRPRSRPRASSGSGSGWGPTARRPRASATSRRASRSRTPSSPSPTCRPRRATRASSSTASTTSPTPGTTSRAASRSRAASPPCGVTTTRWNWRCS